MSELVIAWYIALGILLILMTLGSPFIVRLPLSPAMVYLLAGFLLGPAGLGLIGLHPLRDAGILELLTEAAVLISLFCAGFKLDIRQWRAHWPIPVRLATLSMLVTVALITLAGVWLLQLPLGAAVILGAILAPTDPVLASDVQLADADDRDPLRFALTGEGGLNDGTAFPFLMLGLGLMGLHELGQSGWRWWLLDVLWAVAGGLLLGAALGTLISRLLRWLMQKHQANAGVDEFTAVGLIALAYGLALLCHSYGFLAVFAAGLALGHDLRLHAAAHADERPHSPADGDPAADQPGKPIASFSAQLEHLVELAIVLVLGALIIHIPFNPQALYFIPLLFFVIRPLAVSGGLIGVQLALRRRLLMSWFGIRGIGSLYYLTYAVRHPLPDAVAQQLLSLTVSVVVTSIMVHGISVTPLMHWYERRRRPRP